MIEKSNAETGKFLDFKFEYKDPVMTLSNASGMKSSFKCTAVTNNLNTKEKEYNIGPLANIIFNPATNSWDFELCVMWLAESNKGWEAKLFFRTTQLEVQIFKQVGLDSELTYSFTVPTKFNDFPSNDVIQETRRHISRRFRINTNQAMSIKMKIGILDGLYKYFGKYIDFSFDEEDMNLIKSTMHYSGTAYMKLQGDLSGVQNVIKGKFLNEDFEYKEGVIKIGEQNTECNIDSTQYGLYFKLSENCYIKKISPQDAYLSMCFSVIKFDVYINLNSLDELCVGIEDVVETIPIQYIKIPKTKEIEDFIKQIQNLAKRCHPKKKKDLIWSIIGLFDVSFVDSIKITDKRLISLRGSQNYPLFLFGNLEQKPGIDWLLVGIAAALIFVLVFPLFVLKINKESEDL